MKQIFYALLFISFSSNAQISSSSPWVWIKGSNMVRPHATYGTKGVPDPANNPGGRFRAIHIKDDAGNIWVFGGEAMRAFGTTPTYSNELWKYDIATNTWTWVSGDNTGSSLGVYGTKGVADPANKPRARSYGCGWADASGNIWIFGGVHSAARLNDLWKYDPVTNMWTWMHGDNTQNQLTVHGLQGVADPINKPSSRMGAAYWKDAAGNFWMFAGDGYAADNLGMPSDLWKFDPVTNLWTWVDGNVNGNTYGSYGVKGVESASNAPGSRYTHEAWVDNNGNFWIFGGQGFAAGTLGKLNDLWKYDPVTGNWTWVSGDNVADQFGVYGTQGIEAPGNQPGSRVNALSWKGTDGNFYLYGGNGYSANNDAFLNDLWKYNLVSNRWTWLKGSDSVNIPAVYGTQNIPDPANRPGARNLSVGWTDNAGNFYIFGGNGFDETDFGVLNDIWRLNGSGVLPLQFNSFEVLVQNNQRLLKWQTSQEVNTDHFVIERSPDNNGFQAIGQLDARGNGGQHTGYEFTDAAPMGRNGIFYYRIKSVDLDGSYQYSVIRKVTASGKPDFTVQPNPVSNYFQILGDEIRRLEVFDASGRKRLEKNIAVPGDRICHTGGWSPGVYFIVAYNAAGNRMTRRILKR